MPKKVKKNKVVLLTCITYMFGLLLQNQTLHCVQELYANAFQSCVSYNFETSVMKFHVHYVNTDNIIVDDRSPKHNSTTS